MSSIGDTNHVLTNAGVSGYWDTTDTYTCVTALSTGTAVYRLTSSVSGGASTQDIKYTTSSGWEDNGTLDPKYFGVADSSSSTGYSVLSPVPTTSTQLYLLDTSLNLLTVLNTGYTAGPTVTSITEDTIFVPSDTVVASDFTLKKNTTSYATTNISLTGPADQPPSDARGYTYQLTTSTTHETALYEFTIDSKSYVNIIYDNSWTSSATSGRSTNSTRILNVLATIPTTTSMTILNAGGTAINYNWYNISRYNRYITYAIGSSWDNTYLNAPNERFGFVIEQKDGEIVGYFYYYKKDDVSGTWNESSDFEIGAQETMSWTHTGYTVSITDWVYSAHYEGDGYTPPTSSSISDGGGYKRRYPIVTTNLFDRQRSDYAIGKTHKDFTNTLF